MFDAELGNVTTKSISELEEIVCFLSDENIVSLFLG